MINPPHLTSLFLGIASAFLSYSSAITYIDFATTFDNDGKELGDTTSSSQTFLLDSTTGLTVTVSWTGNFLATNPTPAKSAGWPDGENIRGILNQIQNQTPDNSGAINKVTLTFNSAIDVTILSQDSGNANGDTGAANEKGTITTNGDLWTQNILKGNIVLSSQSNSGTHSLSYDGQNRGAFQIGSKGSTVVSYEYDSTGRAGTTKSSDQFLVGYAYSVPEPSSSLLFGLGALALLARRRA